jgi:protocatechuate 3,4-dioxygenase beta subunit
MFLFCLISFADQTPEETIKNMSKITPSFYSKEMYGAMQDTPDNPTNNLRRTSGSPFFAKGIPLFIEGRVFDISGDPIKNVIVKITHANHYGAYNFIVNKESAVYDPYFLSSGISVTNNIGEYSFLTIMPGFYGKRAPHIHLTIVHETFEFETEMFFANHPRNIKDAKYHKLNLSEKKAVTAKVYYVDQNNFSLGIKAVFDIYINYDF